MSKQEELEQKIQNLLAFHEGGVSDSYGTAKYPQPDWCNGDNCIKYKEECQVCISAQLINLLADSGYGQLEGSNITCPYCEREIYIGDEFIPIVKKEVEG